MRRHLLLLLLFVLSITSAAPSAAASDALARGFVAGKVYDFGNVDSINTFNGNLTLRIPLGPTYPVNGAMSYGLTLSYNSKVWDYETVSNTWTRALPNRRSNGGLGWLVSLGKLISPTDPTNEGSGWQYESPDGALHEFASELHPGDPVTTAVSPVEAVRYTTDGTYLRMLDKNDGTIDVEFPDGNVHTFSEATGKLTRMRDRFSNSVSVAYSATLTGTPCPTTANYVWTLTDSKAARTNYVCMTGAFPYPDSTYEGQVERVIVAAPPTTAGAARTASYLFDYVQTAISRGCHADYPNEAGTNVTVPLLRTLLLPNGSTYSFTYNNTNGSFCQSGTLRSLVLPTRATTVYDYRYYEVPFSQCGGKANMNSYLTGVGQKTVSGPRVATAVWKYSSTLSTTPAQVQCETNQGAQYLKAAPAEQMMVTVVDPLNHRSEHFYSVWPGGDIIPPGGSKVEEYGLPLSRLESSTTSFSVPVYLSSRTYDSAGTKLRTTYLKYDQDPKTWGCYETSGCKGPRNSRVPATRTVYHDDGGAAADSDSSDFDGLGHYRRTRIAGTGTLSAGARETFVGYNARHSEVNPTSGIASGTYTGIGTFTPPPSTTPWLVNLASHAQVTEGGVTATTQSCYDAGTGFLRATRVLKGAVRDLSDAVAVFIPSFGNVGSESYFGGDVRKNASVTSPLCTIATTALPAVDYKIDHTYDWGVRKTSRYSGASFYHLNAVIDRYTGLPTSSIDSSGLQTTYGYDTSSRLTLIAAPDLLRLTYIYSNATSTAPAQVQVKQGTKETYFQYDSLGRLWREKTRMPDTTWSVAETTRDGNGNVAAQSAREKLVITTTEYDFVPSKKTEFSGYDPFGRVATVTAPDNEKVLKSYKGVASSTTTVDVNGATGEAGVSTTERYDRQGRLASVTEAVGTLTEYTTSYGYDVGGRLKSVSMPGGAAGTQTRLFTYDNRGFLSSEQHPELGLAGNGTKSYPIYDARGNVRQQITGTANGPFDLSFTYDEAERVTLVRLTGTSQTLKEFDYDDPSGLSYPQCANNVCNGKLAAAARYNYTTDLGGLVAVTESYQYDAQGKMSRRDTSVGSTSVFTGESFNAAQVHNGLGDVSYHVYPCRTENGTVDGCNATDKAQTFVDQFYVNGFLDSVSPAASKITYAPNGSIHTITHGSGLTAVRETIVPDPTGVPRPCGIFVYGPGVTLLDDATAACGKRLSGTGAQWTSGQYSYDGAGNVKQIGGNTYRYDAFGRLNSWTTAAGTASRSYDAFGNYTATGFAIAGTTNHYTSMTYDAAGNVTNDGKGTYTYDALGMMTGANVGTRQFRYLYRPDEERVAAVERVVVSGVTRAKTTWTLRGIGPQLQRVYFDDSSSGTRVFSWKEDSFWRGGQLLGTDTPAGYRHHGLDHLGSPRIITNASGSLIGTQDFTPFGTGGTSNGGTLQFTGHERDAASLAGGAADMPDYMHARFYRADVGRFLSVDPVLDIATALQLPQRWNRYSYVSNNPMISIDPTGAILISVTGQQTIFDIAGDAAARLRFRDDQTLDTSALTEDDLRNNEGALLLHQMATSGDVYTYREAPFARTAGGNQAVRGVLNLDDNPVDTVLPNGSPLAKGPGRFPSAGVNGAVTLNLSVRYVDGATGTITIPTHAIAFHELAESYARVDQNLMRGPNDGPGAHYIARQREHTLMLQRPRWTQYPAGDLLIPLP